MNSRIRYESLQGILESVEAVEEMLAMINGVVGKLRKADPSLDAASIDRVQRALSRGDARQATIELEYLVGDAALASTVGGAS